MSEETFPYVDDDEYDEKEEQIEQLQSQITELNKKVDNKLSLGGLIAIAFFAALTLYVLNHLG